MKRIITSIWFLAFVIVIPVIVYLPPILKKYTIEYEGKIHSRLVDLKLHFVDLNSDGIKEQVKKYKDSTGRFSIQYFSEGKLAPIDQLNFSNNYNITVNFVFFEDVDKDSYTEIYGFTLKEDSLFLNWFEPYPDKLGLEMVKFITTIKKYQDNKVDVRIHECHFIDLNKDGYKDIIFPVVTGFSLSTGPAP